MLKLCSISCSIAGIYSLVMMDSHTLHLSSESQSTATGHETSQSTVTGHETSQSTATDHETSTGHETFQCTAETPQPKSPQQGRFHTLNFHIINFVTYNVQGK